MSESNTNYKRISNITEKLLLANKDVKEIKDRNWTLSLIDSKQKNAFVLPNGNIFVHKGLLEICSSDDQIGIVLAHELAHTLLSHTEENLSKNALSSLFHIPPILLLWIMLPWTLALVGTIVILQISHFLYELPFHLDAELEADKVGLKLAANACFDIVEAPAFWGKMALINEEKEMVEDFIPEYLSTHPSAMHRQKSLIDLMEEMPVKGSEKEVYMPCGGISYDISNTSPNPVIQYLEYSKRHKNSK